MVFPQFLAQVWGSASLKMWIESSKVWLNFRPKNWWTAGPPFAVFCCSCDRGTTKWAASLWSDAGRGVATVATHGVCDAKLRESSMESMPAVSKRMGPQGKSWRSAQDLLVLAAFAALRVGLFGRYGRRESEMLRRFIVLLPPPKLKHVWAAWQRVLLSVCKGIIRYYWVPQRGGSWIMD